MRNCTLCLLGFLAHYLHSCCRYATYQLYWMEDCGRKALQTVKCGMDSTTVFKYVYIVKYLHYTMNEWWKTGNHGKPDFLKGKSLVLWRVHMSMSCYEFITRCAKVMKRFSKKGFMFLKEKKRRSLMRSSVLEEEFGKEKFILKFSNCFMKEK